MENEYKKISAVSKTQRDDYESLLLPVLLCGSEKNLERVQGYLLSSHKKTVQKQ